MGLKVLLVDDEYIVLKGLEIMLGEQKEIALEIMTAMDAVDAMEKAGRRVSGCDYCRYQYAGDRRADHAGTNQRSSSSMQINYCQRI